MSTPTPQQHLCPRCSAPIQIGQVECNVCRLPLDPASLQAFYNWQQQQAAAPPPAPDPNQPLFHYSVPGIGFTVFRNRIETTRGVFGGAITGKRETIPMRSVTEVAVKGMVRKLHVTTADGRDREYSLGMKNEEARQAILYALLQ